MIKDTNSTLDSVLEELEKLEIKYKHLSRVAVTKFNDSVSHFKFVGKSRGINEAIKIVKKTSKTLK